MPGASEASTRRRSCFVISPIGAHDSETRRHADTVFKYIIQPATEECGILAYRSDHLHDPGRISKEMYDRIFNDDLCIALLTGRNPNVYYELAIAQSAARPVILLLQRDEEVVFDIKDFRFVSYDFLPERLIDERLYARELVQHIRAIENSGWKVECHIPGMADAWKSGREEALQPYERLRTAMESGSFPESIINEAKQYLCFTGMTLDGLRLMGDKFDTMLCEAVARGCDVEAFIMHEKNPALPQMLMDASHLQETRRRILKSWEHWQRIIARCGHKVTAIKVRSGILFQQVTMNETRLLCAPYMTSRIPEEAPALTTVAGSPIYEAMQYELRKLKERNLSPVGSS
jgi:hypothetical protein